MDTERIQLLAHRGIWDAAVPQNTVEAFRRAWAAGATWVETDFHRTAAGQMLCIHAEGELRAYTGCEKRIPDLSPAETAALRLVPPGPYAPPPGENGSVPSPAPDAAESPADGFHIPQLHEVLATVPPHGTLQSEIKTYSDDYAELFDRAVRDAGLSEDNIVVSSFQFDALADFKRRKPGYRTLLLVAPQRDERFAPARWVARCREGGFDHFCPGCAPWGGRLLTREDADDVRAAGIGFRLYGVNSPAELRLARDTGAAAFTCNHWRAAFGWARALGGVELLK